MSRFQLMFMLAVVLAPCVLPAHTQAPEAQTAIRAEDEAAIRALIETWYVAHRAGADGRTDHLRAPGAIDASPGYFYADTSSAVAPPPTYNSLAHTALKFHHEVSSLDIDTRYAKARVWERGYTYAWAAQKTTERLGSATFVLEKQADGRWLVLAHETHTVGIPPGLHTDPMPDLRDLFYSTVGKDRDPEADARAAGRF